jgi:hypothetical protein
VSRPFRRPSSATAAFVAFEPLYLLWGRGIEEGEASGGAGENGFTKGCEVSPWAACFRVSHITSVFHFLFFFFCDTRECRLG